MKYYSTLRPVAPGSYPMADKVVNIVNFEDRTYCNDINYDAWGYVEYSEELPEELADQYDLFAANKKTWFGVVSSYYNNGKVVANIVDKVVSVEKPESQSKYLKRCDVYIDYYGSREEAEKAVEQARNESRNK